MLSSIEQNANAKPTSAHIKANVAVDWLTGAAASLKSCVSKLAGSTLACPAASRRSSSRTRPSCPVSACTKIRVIEFFIPVSLCA